MKTLVMCLMLAGITSAYAEEHDSVIDTACEMHVFSMMRLEDEYKNVYPPLWENNKELVKARVDKCVQEILSETPISSANVER